MAVVGIKTDGNPEQKELIRLIMEKEGNGHGIIICTGNAGTGKNYVSLAAALQCLIEKKYQTIYYGRNPVQCGEEMGFLAGDLDDKYEPFLEPLKDNIKAIAQCHGISVGDAMNKIIALPIAFLRGRSLDQSIIIIDECQNLDLNTLQTIITRKGRWSKLILLGSYNQIDDSKQLRYERCDFEELTNHLTTLFPNYVAHITLYKSMRDEMTAELDNACFELKTKLARERNSKR